VKLETLSTDVYEVFLFLGQYTDHELYACTPRWQQRTLLLMCSAAAAGWTDGDRGHLNYSKCGYHFLKCLDAYIEAWLPQSMPVVVVRLCIGLTQGVNILALNGAACN